MVLVVPDSEAFSFLPCSSCSWCTVPWKNHQIQTLKLFIYKYKTRSRNHVWMLRTYLSNHLFYVTQLSFALCVLSCQGPERDFFVQLCGPAAQQESLANSKKWYDEATNVEYLGEFTSWQGWWRGEGLLLARVVLGKLCDCLVSWMGSWDSCECPVWHGLENSEGVWLAHKIEARLVADCAAGSHRPSGCREPTSPDLSLPLPEGQKNV